MIELIPFPKLLFAVSALTALTLAVAAGVLLRDRLAGSDRARRLLLVAMGALLLVEIGSYLQGIPINYQRLTNDIQLPLVRCMIAAAFVVAAAGLLAHRFVQHWWFPALLVLHMGIGAWSVVLSVDPPIDVYPFYQESIAAMLKGINPYAITMPNIYPLDTPYYAPGMVKDGRFLYGYAYPPINLYLAAPAYLVLGDVRYAMVLAMTASAALIAYARPSRFSFVAAAIFLFAPRTFRVVESAWTEPFIVLFVCATAWAAIRNPRLIPITLGLFLASKQYTFLAAPAALLLIDGPWSIRKAWSIAWQSSAVALAVSLPHVLWDVGAYYHSAYDMQFKMPFRLDSYSWSSIFAIVWDVRMPTLVGVALAAPASLLVLWKFPRSAAGFAAGIAFISLCVFLFSRSFINYYYYAYAAIFCALGVADWNAPVRATTAETSERGVAIGDATRATDRAANGPVRELLNAGNAHEAPHG